MRAIFLSLLMFFCFDVRSEQNRPFAEGHASFEYCMVKIHTRAMKENVLILYHFLDKEVQDELMQSLDTLKDRTVKFHRTIIASVKNTNEERCIEQEQESVEEIKTILASEFNYLFNAYKDANEYISNSQATAYSIDGIFIHWKNISWYIDKIRVLLGKTNLIIDNDRLKLMKPSSKCNTGHKCKDLD